MCRSIWSRWPENSFLYSKPIDKLGCDQRPDIDIFRLTLSQIMVQADRRVEEPNCASSKLSVAPASHSPNACSFTYVWRKVLSWEAGTCVGYLPVESA